MFAMRFALREFCALPMLNFKWSNEALGVSVDARLISLAPLSLQPGVGDPREGDRVGRESAHRGAGQRHDAAALRLHSVPRTRPVSLDPLCCGDGGSMMQICARVMIWKLLSRALLSVSSQILNRVRFDILVNGGGSVTLQFQRQPFQLRRWTVMVPWNRMVTMDTVTLLLEGEEEAAPPGCPAHVSHDHYLMKPLVLSTWQHTQLGACPSKSTVIPESQVRKTEVTPPLRLFMQVVTTEISLLNGPIQQQKRAVKFIAIFVDAGSAGESAGARHGRVPRVPQLGDVRLHVHHHDSTHAR